MRQEVLRFTDILIRQLQANAPDLQAKMELFFKDWDIEDFTQDETEFIVEVEYKAMRIAGFKIDNLLIWVVVRVSLSLLPFSVTHDKTKSPDKYKTFRAF